MLTPMLLLALAAPAQAVEGMVLYTRGSDFGGAGELRLVQLPGGATQTIDSNVRAAVFSPDGQRIIYQRYNGASWELVRIRSDGSDPAVLADGWSETMSLSWRAPNRVIFAHDRQYQLWELNPDNGDVSVFYTSSSNDFWSVSVSTDLTRMTFYSRSQTRGIWIADISGQNEVHVHSGCGNAISPSGARFTNNLSSHQDMYIRNWDQSVDREIGITGEWWNSQRWSRNNDAWILYSRGTDYQLPDYSNVYVRNVDTGEEVQVTADGAHDFHRDFWVGTLQAAPILQLDSSALEFRATEGRGDPAGQEVAVNNAGGGALSDVTVTEDAPWLEVTRTGTGNSQLLSNSVSVAGLDPQSYLARVRVSGGGAADEVFYDVTLVVVADVPDNQPPSVAAGDDQTVAMGSVVTLSGSAADDGLPADTLTVEWTKVSGPGNVVFLSPDQLETDATFALDGSYTLQLAADDGQLQAADQVSVLVEPGETPTVTVVAPNGGEVWEVGSAQRISWTTAVINAVVIRYSVDGGATWEVVSPSVDTQSPQWMAFDWTVPDTPTTEAVVRITEYFDDSLVDDSDSFFEICATGSCSEPEVEDPNAPVPSTELRRLVLGEGCDCGAVGSGGTARGLSPAGLALLLVALVERRRRSGGLDRGGQRAR